MFYLLTAIIIACKFGTCIPMTYQEYARSPAACATLQTRIILMAHRAGYINPQVLNCQTTPVYQS